MRSAPRLILALLAVAGPAVAQLSPGELSHPHRSLEGSAQCLKCHRPRQGVDPQRCLACHQLLRAGIAAGRGLHARPEYEECQRCHVDHHGSDFALVYWGDGGPEAFDHRQAGYALEGRHATLGCRECHRAARIAEPGPLLAAGKDLDRTYLGLATGCEACHADEHRGQFTDAGCLTCHGQEKWKPAPLFDHATTSYPLTGRHRDVGCPKCHPSEADGEKPFVRYRPVAAESCKSCHRDPHRERLGPRCSSCHTTASWRGKVAAASFDHDRTRYALTKRHRRLACRDCHKAGMTAPIPGFERCSTCHDDVHRGQFRHRPDGGRCDACHDLEGFRPARFTPEDHQLYPLTQAHLAVACPACHRVVGAAELVRVDAALGGPAGEIRQYRFPSTACTVCHQDVHRDELDRYLRPTPQDPEGCTGCHNLSHWQSITFEHDRSEYPLTGRHQGVACVKCHPRAAEGDDAGRMRLSGVTTACAGCHRDPHAGQFVRDGEDATCESCHTVFDWRATGFDHDRDSSYKLDGAHARVPCLSCHYTEGDGRGAMWVRYRPLTTACADCHRGRTP